jgi:hypothetical protein
VRVYQFRHIRAAKRLYRAFRRALGVLSGLGRRWQGSQASGRETVLSTASDRKRRILPQAASGAGEARASPGESRAAQDA